MDNFRRYLLTKTDVKKAGGQPADETVGKSVTGVYIPVYYHPTLTDGEIRISFDDVDGHVATNGSIGVQIPTTTSYIATNENGYIRIIKENATDYQGQPTNYGGPYLAFNFGTSSGASSYQTNLIFPSIPQWFTGSYSTTGKLGAAWNPLNNDEIYYVYIPLKNFFDYVIYRREGDTSSYSSGVYSGAGPHIVADDLLFKHIYGTSPDILFEVSK